MGDQLNPGDGVRLLPEQPSFSQQQQARWQGDFPLPYVSPMGTGSSVTAPMGTDTYHDFLRKKYMLGDNGVNNPAAITDAPIAPQNTTISGMNPGFISAFNKGNNTSTSPQLFTKTGLSKVNAGISAATPYLSNLLNSMRKPPKPMQPVMNSYVNLAKVNLDNERAGVRRETHTADVSADRNVDANTAEAVKAFNRGTQFQQLSSIGERESNANSGIANQQTMLDQQTQFSNVDKQNEFNQALTARDIARQREGSENVANAGNKLVLQQNEKSKEKTEYAKARVLRSMYDTSGVLTRDNAQGEQWKKDGLPDPFGEDYKWLDSTKQNTSKKAYGGSMRMPGRKIAC